MESIGSVSVEIVGDYSELQQDLTQAQRVASEGGMEIAAALNRGAAGADTLTASSASASEALKNIGSSAKDTVPQVETMTKSTSGLVGELASLAMKAGVVAALISFGKEALEAADAIDDAGKAMAMLSGNAEEAQQTILRLRDVASDAALGMPELLTAATRMTAFLGSSKDVPDILMAVADSASVMGRSIEGTSASFERIVASGDISKRSLQNLGLTMQDMAEVMGVSADKVKDAFKNMDDSARVEVMIAALHKFKGAAKEMSDDSIGSFQRLKNQFFEFAATVGNVLEPVMHALAGVATELVFSFQKQAVAISHLFGSIVEGAKSATAAMSGDFSGAVNHWEAMKKVWTDGDAAIQKLEADHNRLNQTQAEGTRATDAQIKAQAQAALAHAEAAKAVKHQQEVMAELTKTAKDLYSQLPASYDAYVASLSDGGKTAEAVMKSTEDAIRKTNLAMEGMRGKPLEALHAVVAKLTEVHDRAKAFAAEDLWNKQAQEIASFAGKFQNELGKLDAATLDWVNTMLAAARDIPPALDKMTDAKFLKQWTEEMNKLTEESKKLDTELGKLGNTAARETNKYTAEMTKAIEITATMGDRIGQAMQAFVDMQLALKKAGIATNESLQAEIGTLTDLYNSAVRLNQPVGVRLQLAEKIMQEEIRRAELTGANAASEIFGLEQIKLKQEALYNSTHALGDLAVSVTRDMWEGWHMVFQGIGDAILEGKNFGEAMEQVGKRVAKMLMDDLVNYAFKMLKASIVGVDSSVKDLESSFKSLAKTISDAFKPASPGGGGGTPGFGGGGKTGGGLAGGLSIAGDIASIADAISSIIGNFQMHAMNKSLDVLVQHSLRTLNIVEQWYAAAQDWFGQEFTRLGEIWRDMRAGFEAVVSALTGGRMAVLGPAIDIPDVPGVPSVAGQSAKVYNSTTKSAMSLGGVTIHVTESSNPRETAREIAGALKTMSSRFSTYGT